MKLLLALLLGIIWEVLLYFSVMTLVAFFKGMRPTFFFKYVWEFTKSDMKLMIFFVGLYTWCFYNML